MRGARILIAEDNEINQQVAKEILEHAGATVHIAWNGKEALEALNDLEFDAILMDIQMPEMDGYEATRAIRSDGRFKDLPIIAMTAHAMKGDREKCLKEGMNDHVSKPVNSDTLLSTLAEWMQPAGSLAQKTVEGPPVSLFDNQVELPESIPGIDIESALKRLQGNRRLLKKLLGDFIQKHSDDARKIRAALDTNHIEEAQHISHTLKGSAGNISATDLYHAATKLANALRDENLEGSLRLLSDVQHLLDELTHEVRSLYHPDRVVDREENHISDESRSRLIDQITPDLKEFTRLLGAYDAKAIETYAAVKPHLDMCGIDELIAEMDNFIDIYDLKGALGVLNRIAEQLGTSLK